MIRGGFLHQVIRGGPVAMTIQQRADDAAAQHSGKCFLISRRLKGRHDFITLGKAANVQALFIRWSTSKARHAGRVGFLETFVVCIHWFSDEPTGAHPPGPGSVIKAHASGTLALQSIVLTSYLLLVFFAAKLLT